MMNVNFKKFWNEYGIMGILFAILIFYCVYLLFNYIYKKGISGFEGNATIPNQYKKDQITSQNTVQPSQPIGQNEVFASANGIQTSMPGMQSTCSQPTLSNPSELLPKDNHSQWAQLNPTGKGELANLSLLKAGYHIGIDTIGQTLRNSNLQTRSEPPNPQLNTGPWNQSTIQNDFMRPPLEIGQGGQ
jgi:hypothetical protein